MGPALSSLLSESWKEQTLWLVHCTNQEHLVMFFFPEHNNFEGVMTRKINTSELIFDIWTWGNQHCFNRS